jgi:hypothetical protein
MPKAVHIRKLVADMYLMHIERYQVISARWAVP